MEKLSYRMANKSLNKTLTALEIYNKSDCQYTEKMIYMIQVNELSKYMTSKSKVSTYNPSEFVKKQYI